MIQKDYIIKNPLMAGVAAADIRRILFSTPHKDALVTIYETGFPDIQIRGLIDMLTICEPGGLKVAGLSVLAVTELPSRNSGVRLNLIVTESSEIEVVSLPCSAGEEEICARKLRGRLDAHQDVKALELFVSDNGIDISGFMDQVSRERPDMDIFGTVAFKNAKHHLNSNKDHPFISHSPMAQYINSHFRAIASEPVDDGFVAVIFSGKELKVHTEYALGWHPVGREMSITCGAKGTYGGTAITKIDEMRAVDIYREYLGVVPDEYFVDNICEFPLIVQRDGIDICVIPYDYGPDGEIYVNISLEENEKLRFSYASHDGVLGASQESYDRTAQFVPEALFMIMCANRINFLHEEAGMEWDKFAALAPDYAPVHGGCELYSHNGVGGVLNSAHITVAMREGEAPDKDNNSLPKPSLHQHYNEPIPLSERMSVFLSKMTEELQGMAEEAEAANLAKSAFLSNMSHEIRTPINAVLGMDEMILRESNETGIIEYAEDIRSAGNSLLGIVNDILDFSKIEAGKMDIIPVEYEIASVINDLYTMIRTRAEDKGLTLECTVDPTIPAILYGDEIRIKQVITNILTNAVKYTEKGSISLNFKRVAVSEEEKNKACGEFGDRHGQACFSNPVCIHVSVRDTGIGIKDEDKKKLFSAFERVDEKRNRNIEGTGLGLNITSQLLELMGSHLEVESTYGEGSDFYFDIMQGISRDEPVGDLSTRLTKRISATERYRESFRAPDASILVVDDTPVNLDVIRNLLKKTDIGIDTAESGQEAIDMVKTKAYDVIFLDHRMPNMDGLECLKIMQGMEDNLSKDAPVISLTANAVSGAREEYLKAGFADYLTKPINPAKLEEMLIRYLPEDKIERLKNVKSSTKTEPVRYNADQKNRVVLIDDEPMIHDVARRILGDIYRFDAYTSGDEGIAALKLAPADLILLDVKMPGQDGFAVIKRLKEDERTSSIPVIFLTGDDNRDTEIAGFNEGAWDYVRKPFVSEVLLKRVSHTIELSHLQMSLSDEVARQTLRAEHLSQEIMLALSRAVDAKDHYTQGHSHRVAGYSVALADKLGMSKARQIEIHSMGLLHDVGKIGVHEDILNKPGRLNDDEFEQIKKHTVMGYDILKTITEVPDLATGARWHHERYNGTGYPDGISGEDIPLEARIICVADSYDAMTSKRSYSDMRAKEDVKAEILRCAGTQFDPKIAEAMAALIDEDSEYLMNEHGYDGSRVSKYVSKLLIQEPGREDIQGGTAQPADMSDKDSVLPDWLADTGMLDAGAGVINCGSVDGYLSVLDTFASTIDDKADEIEAYYNNGDWENYTIKVHALKSSARIIGATGLSGMAAALEAAGEGNDIDTIRRDTAACLTLYRSYTKALSYLKSDTSGNPEATPAQLKDAYEALSEFAHNMDYELSVMVLDSIREYSMPDADRKRFDAVKTALSKLDWDAVGKILEENG